MRALIPALATVALLGACGAQPAPTRAPAASPPTSPRHSQSTERMCWAFGVLGHSIMTTRQNGYSAGDALRAVASSGPSREMTALADSLVQSAWSFPIMPTQAERDYLAKAFGAEQYALCMTATESR